MYMYLSVTCNVPTCIRCLIMATGIAKPNKPDFPGQEYVEGYEDMSTDPEDFEGQSVLILGTVVASVIQSLFIVHGQCKAYVAGIRHSKQY